LLTLLADPQWQPYVVFPGEFVANTERVVTELTVQPDKKPLFILLDATWPEACNPINSRATGCAAPSATTTLCTSAVGALCLSLAGEQHAADTLETYLDVFTNH
jgi:DTW domain-containing protein YfiP